jgi:hypothetical protein
MDWPVIAMIAQLSLGGGLVVGGLRYGINYWLSSRDPAFKMEFEKRLGRPVRQVGRNIAIAVLLVLVGAVLLLTARSIAEML